MNPVFFLLAASALAGVLLGLNYLHIAAVLISTLIISVLAAAVLQNEGFGFFPGIAIVVGCQTVHQLGYALGSFLVNQPWLASDQLNNHPDKRRQNNIAGEHEQ